MLCPDFRLKKSPPSPLFSCSSQLPPRSRTVLYCVRERDGLHRHLSLRRSPSPPFLFPRPKTQTRVAPRRRAEKKEREREWAGKNSRTRKTISSASSRSCSQSFVSPLSSLHNSRPSLGLPPTNPLQRKISVCAPFGKRRRREQNRRGVRGKRGCFNLPVYVLIPQEKRHG